MLIEALRQMKDVKATVHAVFTVQEEVGLKGAKTSRFQAEPDVALANRCHHNGRPSGYRQKGFAPSRWEKDLP